MSSLSFATLVMFASMAFLGSAGSVPKCLDTDSDGIEEAAFSLLQVSVEVSKGGVNEVAPATIANSNGTHPHAANASSAPAAVEHHPHNLDPDDMGFEEDELLASTAQVSLAQTGFTVTRQAVRSPEMASLHMEGIEDDEEALGLLDAVAELGM